MANESLIVGNSNWAVKANNLLGYAVGETSGYYVPRELDFTRNSTATYTDENGIIQTAAANIARVQDNALLLEPQRTNLQVYSNSFISNWNLNDVTTSVGESTLIDGQSTILMTENTANAVHRVLSTIATTLTIGQVYTISFYAKSNGSRNIGLRTGITGASANIIFNPNTQAVVSLPSGFTANITSANDGYYRYSITATASVSSDLLSIVMFSGTSLVYTGSGESIYISACQTEAGAYATSYIPTTNSTVTRLADTCSKTGISSLIGDGTGTWFMDFEMVESGSGLAFAFNLSNGTTTNHLFLYWTDTGSTWKWGGSDTSVTLPSTLRKKVAIKYSSGTGKLFCNGSLISTLSLSTAFTRLDLGNRFSQNYPMDGKINQAYFLTTSLTDAECQAITTI